MTGGKILWAKDEAGEIGKRPALEPELFEVSAEALDALRMHTRLTTRRAR